MRFRSSHLAALLALTACGHELTLPPAPLASSPLLSSFTPDHAFAGTPIILDGVALGPLAEAEIHLGASAALRPRVVSDTDPRWVVDVPEDATDGPVTLTNAAGRFVSATLFHYEGAGRLLLGRVSAIASLAPVIDAVFPYGTRGELAFVAHREGDAFSRLFSLDAVGHITEAYTPGLLAAAPINGGESVAVFTTESDNSSPCDVTTEICPREFGVLRYFDADTVAAGDISDHTSFALARFRLAHGFELAGLTSLAISNDGNYALIAADLNAWAVDFSFGDPSIVALDPLADVPLVGATWLIDDRFLVAAGAYVYPVNVSSRVPFAEDGVLITPSGSAAPVPITALAAHAARLAVGTANGTVDLFDTDVWPPTFSGSVELLTHEAPLLAAIGGVAYSDDGTRVAVSKPGLGRVVVADTSGTAIAASTFDAPRAVSAHGGTFWISTATAIGAVAAASGGVISRIAPHSGALAPTLRTMLCQDAPDGPTQLNLELVLPAFDRVDRIDPPTLQPSRCGYTESLSLTAKLLQTEARPAGGRRNQRNERDDDAGGYLYEIGPDGYRPTEVFAAVPRATVGAISVSPADDAVFWIYADDAESSVTNLAVLNPTATYTDGAGWPHLSFDGALVTANVDAAGELVVIGVDDAWILDLAAARLGRKTELRHLAWDETFGVRALNGGVEGDRAWSVLDTGGRISFRSASLSTGALARDIGISDKTSWIATTVAPGGRRLWSLVNSSGGRRLESFAIDGITGELTEAEAPIDLPAGASTLLPYPDGEHVVILDAATDRVLLVE